MSGPSHFVICGLATVFPSRPEAGNIAPGLEGRLVRRRSESRDEA